MARRILGMERPSRRFKTQNKTFVSRKKTEVPNTNTLEIRKQKKKKKILSIYFLNGTQAEDEVEMQPDPPHRRGAAPSASPAALNRKGTKEQLTEAAKSFRRAGFGRNRGRTLFSSFHSPVQRFNQESGFPP